MRMQTPLTTPPSMTAIQGNIQTSMVMSAFETLKTGNQTADILISFLLVNVIAIVLTKATIIAHWFMEKMKALFTFKPKSQPAPSPSVFTLVITDKEDDKNASVFTERENSKGMIHCILDYVTSHHLAQIQQASGRLIVFDRNKDTDRELYLAYQPVLVPSKFTLTTKFKNVDIEISYDETTVSKEDKDEKGLTETRKKSLMGKVTLTVPSDDTFVLKAFIQHCWTQYVDNLFPEKQKEKDPLYYFSPSDDCERDVPIFTRLPLENRRTFDAMFFPDKARVLRVITEFMTRTGKFANPNTPWKLGVLLHGPPGCGKTTFIKALANTLWRNVQAVDLRAIKTNAQLHNVFFYDRVQTPSGGCTVKQEKKIIICEDFDAGSKVMKKRVERVEDETKEAKDDDNEKFAHRSFDLTAFLNTLDGVYEPSGLAYILSTNRREYVDPAIIRAGRITLDIHLTYMVKENICELINFYFPKARITEDEVPNDIDGKYTPAQIEQKCQQAQTVPEVYQLLYQLPSNF